MTTYSNNERACWRLCHRYLRNEIQVRRSKLMDHTQFKKNSLKFKPHERDPKWANQETHQRVSEQLFTWLCNGKGTLYTWRACCKIYQRSQSDGPPPVDGDGRSNAPAKNWALSIPIPQSNNTWHKGPKMISRNATMDLQHLWSSRCNRRHQVPARGIPIRQWRRGKVQRSKWTFIQP